MNTNPHELNPEHIRNPEVQYEGRDLSARGVLLFLLSLVLMFVFMHFILWAMFRYFGHEQLKPQPPQAATMTQAKTLPHGDPTRAFPAPQLQPDPVGDLNKFRTREEQILNSYDYVDKDNGVVRIPIDRAIDLTAQRGLPTRQAGQAAVPAAAPAQTTTGAGAAPGRQTQ